MARATAAIARRPALAFEAPAAARDLKVGQVLHDAGAFGEDVWRIESGALRLDLVGRRGERFVQLALPGDHLGIEALCGLPALYRATAVTPCVLRRLDVRDEPAQHAVVSGTLVRQWCRAADQMTLRSGSAGERVRQLLLLLGGLGPDPVIGWAALELPRLADIAAIVDTAPETVSRILNHWRREGVLQGTGAADARLDFRRLAACEISMGITRSAVGDAATRRRGAPLAQGRP